MRCCLGGRALDPILVGELSLFPTFRDIRVVRSETNIPAHPRDLSSDAIAVFARTPTPGRTKTRLIPLLGPRGAAELQASLIRDTLSKVTALHGQFSRFLFVTGKRSSILSTDALGTSMRRKRYAKHPHLAGIAVLRQRGEDLAERLEGAFRALMRQHSRVVVIGTDSPMLRPRYLRLAFHELRVCDAVLGPCPDGGYYLIGLRRFTRGLFRDIRWGGSSAFQDTTRNILQQDLSCSILPPIEDIDRPQDLERLATELTRNQSARRLAPATWKFLRSRHCA